MPTLATNKKAYHDYEILDEFEAGIQLTGPEVKSAKSNRMQLKNSFAKINKDHEVYLHNAYIAPYKKATQEDYKPRRTRKLLLKSYEIDSLYGAMKGENLTIVPLKVYTNRRGLIKVKLGLARGKKKYDKRKKIKEKDIERTIEKEKKSYKYM